MSLLINAADAIVTALNAASVNETLSQSFTAIRKYIPRTDLKDMGTIHVTVVPAISTPARVSRTRINLSMVITVAVQQRSTLADPDSDATTFDPLVTLVEEIDALLLDTTLTIDLTKITILSAAEREAFLYEHMDKYRQFTSITHYTMVAHY